MEGGLEWMIEPACNSCLTGVLKPTVATPPGNRRTRRSGAGGGGGAAPGGSGKIASHPVAEGTPGLAPDAV